MQYCLVYVVVSILCKDIYCVVSVLQIPFEEALTKIDGLYVEVHDFEERGMMAENFNKISDHLKGFGKTVEKLQADCMLVY